MTIARYAIRELRIMTRDVLIRLSGLQATEGDEGVVEVITAGDYFWKNNKHYLIYDEVMEGTGRSHPQYHETDSGEAGDQKERAGVCQHGI